MADSTQTPAQPDPVGALARDLERAHRAIADLGARVTRVTQDVGGRVDDLSRGLAQLAQIVTDLGDTVARVAQAGPGAQAGDDDPGGRIPPGSFLGGHTHVLDAVGGLGEWVGRVYLRYPGTHLPTCWAWHPDVVEELTWLWQAWLGALDGRGASWAAVGDWHERWRPGVVARVERATRSCHLGEHSPGGRGVRPPREAPLTGALPRITACWAAHEDMPEPTQLELAAAEAYERSEQSPVP